MKHSLKYLVVALTLTTATVASADGFLTDSYGSSAQSASAFGASGASSDRETWATYARPSAAPAGTSVNYVAFTDPLTGWQGQDFDTLGKIAAQNPRTTVRFNADGLTRETANHLADRLRRANFEGQLVLAAGSYTTETLSPFRASGAKEIVLAPER